MKRTWSIEEKIFILNEAKATGIVETCRKHGIYVTTYYRRVVSVECTTPECSAQQTSSKITISVHPNPYTYTLLDNDTICPGATKTLTLSGSQNGTIFEYTLYKDGILVPGSLQTGTGNPLSWDVTDTSCNLFSFL